MIGTLVEISGQQQSTHLLRLESAWSFRRGWLSFSIASSPPAELTIVATAIAENAAGNVPPIAREDNFECYPRRIRIGTLIRTLERDRERGVLRLLQKEVLYQVGECIFVYYYFSPKVKKLRGWLSLQARTNRVRINPIRYMQEKNRKKNLIIFLLFISKRLLIQPGIT